MSGSIGRRHSLEAPRVMATAPFSRYECESLLLEMFQNPVASSWLLDFSDAPTLCKFPDGHFDALHVGYSMLKPQSDAHAFSTDSLSDFIPMYRSLVIPHYESNHLVLGVLYTDHRSADTFFPSSDVRESSPITRVVIDLRMSHKMQILHYIPLTNGQTVCSVSQYTPFLGFYVTRFLLNKLDGKRIPKYSDIARWIRTLEVPKCKLCLDTRLADCMCRRRIDSLLGQMRVNSWTDWVRKASLLRNGAVQDTTIAIYDSMGDPVHTTEIKTCMHVSKSTPNTHPVMHQQYVSMLVHDNLRETQILSSRRPLLPLLNGKEKENSGESESLYSDPSRSSRKIPLFAVYNENRASTALPFREREQIADALDAIIEGKDTVEVKEVMETLIAENGTNQKNSIVTKTEGDLSMDHQEDVIHESGGIQSESSGKKRKSEGILLDTNDEKRFTCTVCGAAFKRRYDRERHFKSKHIGERSWNCDQCHQKFKHRWHLQAHQNVIHQKRDAQTKDEVQLTDT